MARVLMPLPDRDFDPTEAAVPWKTLRDAGHEVVFATERGAVAACDPLLVSGVFFDELGAKPDPKELYAAMIASSEPLYGAVDDGALAIALPRFVRKELEWRAPTPAPAPTRPRRAPKPRL